MQHVSISSLHAIPSFCARMVRFISLLTVLRSGHTKKVPDPQRSRRRCERVRRGVGYNTGPSSVLFNSLPFLYFFLPITYLVFWRLRSREQRTSG